MSKFGACQWSRKISTRRHNVETWCMPMESDLFLLHRRFCSSSLLYDWLVEMTSQKNLNFTSTFFFSSFPSTKRKTTRCVHCTFPSIWRRKYHRLPVFVELAYCMKWYVFILKVLPKKLRELVSTSIAQMYSAPRDLHAKQCKRVMPNVHLCLIFWFRLLFDSSM